MKNRKVEFQFSEETINHIAERVAERIIKATKEYVKEGIQYRLLDEDTVTMITNAIRSIDDPNLAKIEISIVSAQGQLYSTVKEEAFKKVRDEMNREIKRLRHLREERANAKKL